MQVDKIWSVCLQDIVSPEDAFGFGESFAWDELSSHSTEDERKATLFMELMALLPPEKSSFTYDCIRANCFSLGVPQIFSVALSNYLESQKSLVGSNFYPRRRLVDKLIGDAPSMAPAFAPSMSSGGEVHSPLSVAEAPLTPSNSLNMEPPSPYYPSKSAHKHQGVAPPVSPSEEHHDYMKVVLLAVLPTAALSFLAAFLCFYCCGCNKSKVSVGEQRDDHPLLHLQFSNLPGEDTSLLSTW